MVMRPAARHHWNQRYAADGAMEQAAPFLVARAAMLPRTGTALDVAGGAGRNAIWLAQRGLDVTLVDVSDAACDLARRRAAAAGVRLQVVRIDLERVPVPAGPWQVVLVHHYLDRDLLTAAPRLLAPGGVLLMCQPTVRNLERHRRPPRRWLVETGELADLVRGLTDVEVVELTEDWTAESRHEAHLVLRRVAPPRDPGHGA